jgi:hypothetical protein
MHLGVAACAPSHHDVSHCQTPDTQQNHVQLTKAVPALWLDDTQTGHIMNWKRHEHKV